MQHKTILVATDGSPAASAAVEAAVDLAAALRRTVRFVHAASPLAEELFAEYVGDGPPVERILAADSVLASAVECARQHGVEVEVELIGDASSADLAAAIAGDAEGSDASMIVVGSRGRGSVAGAVLGSVSQNLIKYATVPVLVVHDAGGSSGR